MTPLFKRHEALIYSAVGLVALFLILIAFNFLASLGAVRADLTEGNLYTLSEGTKKILRGLESPVKVKLYISRGEQAMPVQLRSFAQRVEDMAREFKSVAGGRELADKVLSLGLWPALKPQLLPFCNALRVALGLPEIEDMLA